MNSETDKVCFYTSYSGIKLPLKLVGEISQESMGNRNTYFEGHFDADGRLSICRKIVYGETEVEHRYSYHDNGHLKQAIIIEEDEQNILNFSAEEESFCLSKR